MDQIRAQLAQLMESIQTEDKGKGKNFTDDDVCKFYLTGLCPFQLHEATTQKLFRGHCEKIHSEELRTKYMEARKTKRYYYEEELIRLIIPIVEEADKRIRKGHQRCEEEDKEIDFPEEVKKLDDKIQEQMKVVEELGAVGNIDESRTIMEEIDEMNKKKSKLIEFSKKISYDASVNSPFGKLKPCEVCGALLAASDKRTSEHFSGKIHMTIQAVRDVYQLTQKYLREEAPLIDAKSLIEKFQKPGLKTVFKGKGFIESDPIEAVPEMKEKEKEKERDKKGRKRKSRHKDKKHRTSSRRRHKKSHKKHKRSKRSDYSDSEEESEKEDEEEDEKDFDEMTEKEKKKKGA